MPFRKVNCLSGGHFAAYYSGKLKRIVMINSLVRICNPRPQTRDFQSRYCHFLKPRWCGFVIRAFQMQDL